MGSLTFPGSQHRPSVACAIIIPRRRTPCHVPTLCAQSWAQSWTQSWAQSSQHFSVSPRHTALKAHRTAASRARSRTVGLFLPVSNPISLPLFSYHLPPRPSSIRSSASIMTTAFPRMTHIPSRTFSLFGLLSVASSRTMLRKTYRSTIAISTLRQESAQAIEGRKTYIVTAQRAHDFPRAV